MQNAYGMYLPGGGLENTLIQGNVFDGNALGLLWTQASAVSFGGLPAPLVPLTEEQQAEQAERQRQWQEQEKQRRAEQQVAEDKAYALLVEAIGQEAALRLLQGGGYVIESTKWPGISYVVSRLKRVQILDRRTRLGKKALALKESCLIVPENVPWPDKVLTLIRQIQADETVVFTVGNVFDV